MSEGRNGSYSDIYSRQVELEARIERRDEKLAVSIDALASAVSKLNSRIDAFVSVHQKFVFGVLVLMGVLILGKEYVGPVVGKYVGGARNSAIEGE